MPGTAAVEAVLAALCLLSSGCHALSLSPVQENRYIISSHRLNISQGTYLTLYTYPETMYNIKEEETAYVMMDYEPDRVEKKVELTLSLSDDSVATLHNQSLVILPGNSASGASIIATEVLHGANSSTANVTAQKMRWRIAVTGKFLGRTQILVSVKQNDSNSTTPAVLEGFKYRMSVVRKPRIVDFAFRIIIWLFVVFANTGMGCEIDLGIVRDVIKKPFAPAIGFVSQYLFMPMISFGVLQLIALPGSTALGYFGVGCAPGGGASNFYCLLLAGDVSLSITMTLISTVGAFGMTPLYMFTLGQLILKQRDVNIKIPYINIVITLLLILIPSVIGYAIQRRCPKVAKVYRKILKPIILVFVIFLFTFGVYANLFIWKLFSPAMIAAGCALPYAGFILGGLAAFICRQPWPRIKTIALETGIQNPGVPILLLQTSLPQPDADLSIVGPVAAATFTPFPLFIWVAVRIIYYKCYLKESPFKRREDRDMEIEMQGKAQASDANAIREAGAADANEEHEAAAFIKRRGPKNTQI